MVGIFIDHGGKFDLTHTPFTIDDITVSWSAFGANLLAGSVHEFADYGNYTNASVWSVQKATLHGYGSSLDTILGGDTTVGGSFNNYTSQHQVGDVGMTGFGGHADLGSVPWYVDIEIGGVSNSADIDYADETYIGIEGAVNPYLNVSGFAPIIEIEDSVGVRAH